MVEAQGAAVEAALWSALDGARGARRAPGADRRPDARDRAPHRARFREGAREAGERAALIRRVLGIRGGRRGPRSAAG